MCVLVDGAGVVAVVSCCCCRFLVASLVDGLSDNDHGWRDCCILPSLVRPNDSDPWVKVSSLHHDQYSPKSLSEKRESILPSAMFRSCVF